MTSMLTSCFGWPAVLRKHEGSDFSSSVLPSFLCENTLGRLSML